MSDLFSLGLVDANYAPGDFNGTLDETSIVTHYTVGNAGTVMAPQVFTWAPALDLTDGYAEPIIPGSVRLAFGGKTLVDRQGRLYADINPATGAGVEVGALDYSTGAVTLTAWAPGAANGGSIQAMLTQAAAHEHTAQLSFRTASAPLRPGGLVLQFVWAEGGGTVTVTATTDGLISAADVMGKVDYQTGIVRILFGHWTTAAGHELEWWYHPDLVTDDGKIWQPRAIQADTLRYAAVAYSYIPLDKDILGIDPVRLPTDGRVPIFRVGDVAVVHHTADASLTSLTVPQTIDLGRTRLSRVWLFDEGADDARVATTHYTVDLDAGTVTLTDAAGLVGPIRIEHRIEDMALISDVQINGQLTFTRPLTHDYPALETGVSSALVIGDLQARVSALFDQQTWTGVWSDALIGNATSAEFNATQYPLIVTNQGAVQERWYAYFATPTTVNIVGESVGQIASGLSITTEIAPVNPATGVPYFRINPLGWGSGWASGNVLRFNTVAANFPLWLARTVKQGPGIEGGDAFRIQIRGDAN